MNVVKIVWLIGLSSRIKKIRIIPNASQSEKFTFNDEHTDGRDNISVCAELALVWIIKDAPGKSGGEWIMKVIRELVCLLCTCLKLPATISTAFE